MKKYIITWVSFTAFSLMLCTSNTYSQYQNKGLIEYSWSNIYSDSSQKEKIHWREWSRIWFKDSCVIYEQRINYETADHTSEGTIVKKSYPVWRYIYLDLRTMKCQDYQNFKDTAKPFCNYSLKLSDAIGIWKFFAPKDTSASQQRISIMSDSCVNNVLYKRVKFLYKFYSITGDYYIHYLNRDTFPNMFHLNRTMDNLFPGYKGTRIDLINKHGNVTGRTEYKVIRYTLTDVEETIFNQWKKNANNTQLPLLTQAEAIRTCEANYEHENPTITIKPLEKR